MRTIAVGTMNPVKIRAAETVARRIWPEAEVRGVTVESGVDVQPRSETETRQGALNRAIAAREALDADLGLGLEGGVEELRGRLYLINSVVAVDRAGQRGEGGGVRMELPPAFLAGLDQGQELGHLIDAASGQVNSKQKDGAIGLLTAGLANRQESFEQALTYALVRWLAPSLYPRPAALSFRPSTPADLPFIHAAEEQAWADGFIGHDSSATHAAWMTDPDVDHRLVLNHGAPAGYLILRGLANGAGAIEVKRICLAERGTGLGTAVFAWLLPWAFGERGARKVWLDVYVENTRAQRTYQRAGFREVGRIQEPPNSPRGERSLILMELRRDDWSAR